MVLRAVLFLFRLQRCAAQGRARPWVGRRHTKRQDLVVVLRPTNGANEQRDRDLVAKSAIFDGGRRNLHRGEVGSPRPVEP